MAIAFHLVKSGDTHWGFRLSGGTDFVEPLTVAKVDPGGIADNAGIKLGDLVVRINDTATSNLTHTEAHDLITEAGYDLVIGIRRDGDHVTIDVTQEVEKTHREEDLNLTDEEIASIITSKTKTYEESEKQSVYQEESSYQKEEVSYKQTEISYKEAESSYQEEEEEKEEESSSPEEESSYQEDETNYQEKQLSYQEVEKASYQKEESSYQKEELSYQQKESSYQEKESSYHQEESSYQQEISSYQQKASSYQEVEACYQKDASINQKQSYSQLENSSSHVERLVESRTASEIDAEEKKWSTFLQKPNNPKPKPKLKEFEKPQAPPYRVVIKKQKRKTEEEKEKERKEKELNTVALMLQSIESKLAEEQEMEVYAEEVEASQISESHSEVAVEASMEAHMEAHVEASCEMHVEMQESREMVMEEASQVVEEILQEAEESQIAQEFDIGSKHVLSDYFGLGTQLAATTKALEEQFAKLQERQSALRSSQSLEEQLSQVQAQLLALAQLPSAIQQTLSAVTQQLEKITVSASIRTEEEEEIEVICDEDITPTDDDLTEREITLEEDKSQATLNTVHEEMEVSVSRSEMHAEMHSESHYEEEYSEVLSSESGLTEEEREARHRLQEKEKKMQKEFAQRRLEQRETKPLTPMERPIILPGGRRWSQPDDACPNKIRQPKMSDEKICNTIETFSEVLVGRTKGINFLKYQPPPKKLDHLERSEVYRMIHESEVSASTGIIGRSGIVAAEEDYYEKVEH